MGLRRFTVLSLLTAACLTVFTAPALALIERLMPLTSVLDDSDEVFVAHFERIDAEKPSAILVWDKDLQGKTKHRRLPVNLTGDKEKHTPEFLKRIAPKLPVVLFVTRRDEKYLALGYTDGTWFQLIGTNADDGTTVRWVFTHCEIYLRRTFTGTTKEMITVVTDAVAGKKKPPKPNPKEAPGFGPEVKTDEKTESQKPDDEGKLKSEIRSYLRGPTLIASVPARGLEFTTTPLLLCSPTPLLSAIVRDRVQPAHRQAYASRSPVDYTLVVWPAIGVVTLPFLAPLAVLLQLLFPGLLRDQWRQYRIVISVLMTQSTLLAVHWAVVRWGVTVRPRWLADDVLWGAMVAVAFIGLVAALIARWRLPASPAAPALRPAPVEYVAVWVLLVTGIGWAAFLYFTGGSPFDQMFVATIAAGVGAAHLWFRSRRAKSPSSAPPSRLTTELALLSGLVLAGSGLGLHVNASQTNQVAGAVTAEWRMLRGNPARTGSVSADDPGAASPEILWVFDPKERKGRIRLHSSPAVVDGQVYIGALYELQSLTEGAMYCVNALDGRAAGEKTLKAGERTWRFTGDGTLKPVFSSPTIAGGRLFFGEGYHQDQSCRLFCLDARSADRPLWTFPTTSHVESSPCLVGSRIYFGAGDDGVFCLDAGELLSQGDQPAIPKQVWQFPYVHVDGSCLVADGKLFVGSVLGDVYKDYCALAINAETGEGIWRITAPMPLPASPAYADGRVYFGLGNGKFDVDADQPAGAVWCLESAKGEPVWQFETAGSVLATPAIAGERVIVCARDAHCYCLSQATGARMWKVDLGGPINASPIVAGGKVYVLTVSGLLACLAEDDGKELWRLTLDVPDDDAYSSPTLVDGKLYVAAGGKLYCIGDRGPQAR
jgi:outer membrane protein assembly factor BamB